MVYSGIVMHFESYRHCAYSSILDVTKAHMRKDCLQYVHTYVTGNGMLYLLSECLQFAIVIISDSHYYGRWNSV